VEASSWADCYGCFLGYWTEIADAVQAYIQAKLKGEVWVSLPEGMWPPEWSRMGIRKPVVRLIKALYGHPDSGTAWEEH
jgi:hypothetical protein